MTNTDNSRATLALTCLDLTNLNDDCTPADIEALCERAFTPFGHVAAICIWPRFVKQAAGLLAGKPVRIATVVNFPAGGEDREAVMAETKAVVADGANEVDLVIPYRRIGDEPDLAYGMVTGTRSVAGKTLLKVILETGELQDEAMIRKASEIAIDAGADFIKTSTGKVAVNATPEAARIMLAVIAEQGGDVGFKPAGGIRTLDEANLYLNLAEEALGPDWATPRSFRFGASSLIDNLLAVLEGRTGDDAGGGY
ncbi:MAG TPA: deoxyribose-phosphate aldolase [Afifellaceae bacterium]|nr:deoxyribose-phosphate aldolase [Afifellaceae bacterium]